MAVWLNSGSTQKPPFLQLLNISSMLTLYSFKLFKGHQASNNSVFKKHQAFSNIIFKILKSLPLLPDTNILSLILGCTPPLDAKIRVSYLL